MQPASGGNGQLRPMSTHTYTYVLLLCTRYPGLARTCILHNSCRMSTVRQTAPGQQVWPLAAVACVRACGLVREHSTAQCQHGASTVPARRAGRTPLPLPTLSLVALQLLQQLQPGVARARHGVRRAAPASASISAAIVNHTIIKYIRRVIAATAPTATATATAPRDEERGEAGEGLCRLGCVVPPRSSARANNTAAQTADATPPSADLCLKSDKVVTVLGGESPGESASGIVCADDPNCCTRRRCRSDMIKHHDALPQSE
eukprot:COSAG01_NODE_5419_length_4274_cov_5.445509_3_plen_261_part_00